MKNEWPENVQKILSIGLSLEHQGVHNWALPSVNIRGVIEQLEMEKVGILGGDVYMISGGELHPNYDSWHCEKGSEESDCDFVRRSLIETQRYVDNYTQNISSDAFFVLVPSVA